ncbi:MAG: DUF1934 domain-containing protein [Ruminococcaceae bacterium]|nr:DUF1934 domain-containing protein [Oscillospiraceae bacterium]
MKRKVMLSIRGTQHYEEQEPEVIELITEGTLEKKESSWELIYQESDLTGLAGVTTSFLLEDDKIVLTRTGKLNSQMVFQVGVLHNSLYEMEFGALMLTVCASNIDYDLSESGGTIDLVYGIEIEQASAGVIDYHLEISAVK